jgi:hypothetical protein
MARRMLRRVSSLAAGRRSKWVFLGVWVIIGVALSPLQPWPSRRGAAKPEPALEPR